MNPTTTTTTQPAPTMPTGWAAMTATATATCCLEPVCDGCHAETSPQGWFAGDDGAQYCAACFRRAMAR